VLQPGDHGRNITARVTATDFGYGTATAVTSNSINDVQDGVLGDPSPLPTISGTSQVGQVLTVTNGTYPVSGVAVAFDWQYFDGGNWQETGEPQTPTHTVTLFDLQHGGQLRAVVYGSKEGYDSDTVHATEGATVTQGAILLVTPPTVKKTSAGFSLVGGTWSPAHFTSVQYGWEVFDASGSLDFGTSNPTLPLAGTAGKYVTVVVRHSEGGYDSSYSAPIAAQLGSAPTTSDSLAVTGLPQVDVTLQAPVLTWLPAFGSSNYQWQYKTGATWKNLGANSTQHLYNPIAADLGRVLRVVVTQLTTGYAKATVASSPTSAVAIGQTLEPVSSPTVSGPLGTGDVLSVSSGVWAPTQTKVSYQWESSPNPSGGPYTRLPGGAASTLLLTQNLIGKFIFANVSASLAGHSAGSFLASAGASPVAVDGLSPSAPTTVSHSGSVYTVRGGTFSPAADPGGVTYRWSYTDGDDANPSTFAADTPAAGHSTDSLDLSTTGHENAPWYVSVEGTRVADGYLPTSLPTVLIKKGDILPSSSTPIMLNPSTEVSQSVAPSTIDWGVTSPVLSYQWQYLAGSTWKSIAASGGGTGSSFTPSASYLNKELRVIVTAHHSDFNQGTAISHVTTVDPADAPVAGSGASAPSIAGDVNVGSRLTALPGTWNVTGLTYHYQWSSSTDDATWTPIAHATSSTYVIPDADFFTTYVEATITASKSGYLDGTGTADSGSVPGFGTLAVTKNPTVTFKSGKYTVSGGSWSPQPTGGISYYWIAYDPATDNQTDISADPTHHANTFTPPAADAGKKILVSVNPQRAFYGGGGVNLIARVGTKIVSSPTPTLIGTPVVGGTLTVTPGTWNVLSPAVSEQWYVNGKATPASLNSDSFALTAFYFGKIISVKVTVTKPGYGTATYLLTSTPTLSNVALAATGGPIISGTAKTDSTLTASPGQWNVAGLTFAYQWYRSGTQIPGASASTYVLSATDVGEEITVGVTGHKTCYTPVQQFSEATTADTGDAPAYLPIVPIPIAGARTLGSTLTATVGGFSLPVTLTYQWYLYDSGSSSWNPIVGANSNSYPISATDGVAVGSELKLEVFGQRPGHAPVSIESAILTVSG
jgi:hypothetical protein